MSILYKADHTTKHQYITKNFYVSMHNEYSLQHGLQLIT